MNEDLAIERREALDSIVTEALRHREYDSELPFWPDVVDDVVRSLLMAGVEPKQEGTQ